jgi:hypothetical protein
MNRKYNFSEIVSIAGLILVLGMARGSDALMASLKQRNSETFTLNFVILWSWPLITLFLDAILLLLFRFVLNRARRNIWIALIYLLIGLFIVAYPALYYVPALCCWFPQFDASVISPTTYMFTVGGIVAIIGLFILILPRSSE